MRPETKDLSRLWDILNGARNVVEYTTGQTFDQFLADGKTRHAVERNLEIIGEAARCVSETTRERLPEVPWKSMIGLRNVLVHEYGEIRYEILWLIMQEKLRPLILMLEALDIDNPPSAKDS